jgi:outer membrane protein assembly factor BamB
MQRAVNRLALAATALWLGAALPASATHIALSPDADHPGATVKVKGKHFGINEPVDVYFDFTDELLVATNGKGGFPNHNLPVPADAFPGEHWVTAIGRNDGLAAQALITVGTDWATYRFANDRNGANAYENVLSPANASGLTANWTVPFSENSYVNSSPSVVGGVVYVGSSDNGLHAVDASTGESLWTAPLHNVVSSSPALANGVVYATDGNLFAFDAATGSQLWEADLAGVASYSSPAVSNGVVYVGSLDGNLYALDASSGAKLWSANTGTPLFSSPAIVNGVAYVGATETGGYLYAFNASTGALLWQAGTCFYCNITGTPAVANGVVYAGNWEYDDYDFYAFNASTGAIMWAAKLGRVIDSSAAVANGFVYIETDGQYTHTDNDVIAMNASTGAIVWSDVVPTSNGGGVIMSSPAIANGVLYVGSGDGTLYALNASSGSRLWNSGSLGEFVMASPAVSNGAVYVESGSNANTGNLSAFALNGGNHAVQKRKHPLPPSFTSLHRNFRLKISQ